MNTVRCIARLDVKGPNLVKGIHLEGLRVLGKPENFSKHYYDHGIDELFYQDVVASLFERNSLHELISNTAKFSYIPLTVGGGIRTIDDINKVLRAGADKVALNTAAIKNPEIIRQASLKFGSSTIVVAIEVIKQSNGEYLAFTDNGREYTGIEAVGWAKKAVELGAGEIVVTSIDNDGTGNGFDVDIIKKISSIVEVPVIAHGGAGKLSDIKEAVDAGANSLALASVLHYDLLSKGILKEAYEKEGNIEFLKSGKTFSKINPFGINEIKIYMKNEKIPCRL